MTSQTNEQALEAAIEKCLTGTCLEERKTGYETRTVVSERVPLYRGGNGYYIGSPDNFEAKYAIDTFHFWGFLEATQEEELNKLKRQSDWKLRILERLDRMIKKNGIVSLLRKGLEVEDAHFTLFYQLPLASSGE